MDVYLVPAHWRVYTITLGMYNIVMCVVIAWIWQSIRTVLVLTGAQKLLPEAYKM